MCCSLWQAVPESSWYFNTILRCFMRAVYGNVVFSRSKMDAHHKSLVFFRSLLLTAVANLMFCVFLYILWYLCDSMLMRCSLWQAVPESSWYFNAILRCFLRAVYGNVVFFRSKMDAHHKRLVFFRSFLLTSVANPMFCVYLFAYFAEICVALRCALQSVACSSWVELVIWCNFTLFSDSRLWECRVFSFKNGCTS